MSALIFVLEISQVDSKTWLIVKNAKKDQSQANFQSPTSIFELERNFRFENLSPCTNQSKKIHKSRKSAIIYRT